MNRITVEGPPRTRGRRYGARAAPLVHRSIASYRDLFARRADLAWDEAVAHARRFVSAIDAFSPDALEEMHGLADGAQVPFEAILVLNCRSELMFAAARSKGELPPSECTSFAVTPEASADGHMLLGQNWDWVPFARDACVMIDALRDDKPSYATIVEAGMLAKVGMNAAGFGLCTNTLVSDRDMGRVGVPYHVMLRALLDAESVADAGRILGSVERALSANYLVADRTGQAMNFETIAGGAAEIVATSPTGGLLSHANHFLAPAFASIDAYVAKSPHSLTRLGDLRDGLADDAQPTLASMQGLLRNHRHAPNGVCSHPDPAAHPMYARCTVASFVADLSAGEFWFTDGPPCESAYLRFGNMDRPRVSGTAS
jgi:isopenicillin-N N-acyltransferase-like protein